jgi:hypothetical protein
MEFPVIKAARTALILMFCLLTGGMMLASGESVLTTALVLAGFTMIVVGGYRVRTRVRTRLGKADDFSFSLTDLSAWDRRDLTLLLLHLAVGIALLGAGFSGLRGGA